MILWMFDTSTRELVYCAPQAGALRFSLDVIKSFDETASEVSLRRALPRANNSNLIVDGGLKFR